MNEIVPAISIIIPVYNNAGDLAECLSALQVAVADVPVEIIAIDDASSDGSGAIAIDKGVTVHTVENQGGAAAARNLGAERAQGEILLFVDSDVVVKPDVISLVYECLQNEPDVAAVFGSYDDAPRGPGLVSQYRNLLHHYTHQVGNPDAASFWTGIGAIRRRVFREMGGLDTNCRLDDVELGYRVYDAGYHIRFDPDIQGKHLKVWSLWSMIRTDVCLRAIPWAQLMLEGRVPRFNLNISPAQRLSVVLSGLFWLTLLAAFLDARFLFLSAALLAGILVLNRGLFSFLREKRGTWFSLCCLPLHLLYYTYSGASFAYAWIQYRFPIGDRGK